MNQKSITTDSQKEQLTQVDESNLVIGPIDRGLAHTSGVYYRTIYVLVFNYKNEILLQKRSSTKDLYPSCWDLSVGGHVNFGKSYLETATRELSEEIGLKVKKKDLKFLGEVLVRLPKSNEFFNVFEYHLKPTDKIIASKDEVNDILWMNIDNIKKSINEKTLAWYPRPEQVISALYSNK